MNAIVNVWPVAVGQRPVAILSSGVWQLVIGSQRLRAAERVVSLQQQPLVNGRVMPSCSAWYVVLRHGE